ncbi:MAG: hypothetical protein H6585_11945 [Flavobacteriales bacterium]|nr:hypothetical protein [Flavobacteriales bacterium]MCB9449042.1 hypothetical protein [Flavobacteriales bacterium]
MKKEKNNVEIEQVSSEANWRLRYAAVLAFEVVLIILFYLITRMYQ